MKKIVFLFPISVILVSCNFVPITDYTSDTPWWVYSLIGLGLLVFIWFIRDKPGWEWDGPPGCPAEIARLSGILFALALLVFGIIGAFYPRAIQWLESGVDFLNDLVSAWEIIVGLILMGVFIYFLVIKSGYSILVQHRDLEEEDGCSFVFWIIAITGYFYWLISTGRWREFIEPFTRLFGR